MSRPLALTAADGSSSTNVLSSVMGMVNSAKEKWDASGANEAMGRVTASIPESTKTYVGRLCKREHLRSFTVFFGIGEERPFYVEKTPSLLLERLRHNFTFFYLNYLVVALILFVLTMITSPTTLIGIALLVFAWMWFLRASQSGTVTIGTVSIPQKPASIALGALSFLVLLKLLSNTFWWTLFSAGFLVSLHAFFRDASLHKDMEDKVMMEGDLHLGEDASFLNAAKVEQV